MRIDAWEMRCRFNRALYYEKVLTGELVAILNHTNPSRKGPPNTVHKEYYYRLTPNGDNLARVSQFVNPDGTLAAGRLPDPKELFLNGIQYYLHPGPPYKKEPQLRLPFQWMQRAYVYWRKKIKCPWLGR